MAAANHARADTDNQDAHGSTAPAVLKFYDAFCPQLTAHRCVLVSKA